MYLKITWHLDLQQSIGNYNPTLQEGDKVAGIVQLPRLQKSIKQEWLEFLLYSIYLIMWVNF